MGTGPVGHCCADGMWERPIRHTTAITSFYALSHEGTRGMEWGCEGSLHVSP